MKKNRTRDIVIFVCLLIIAVLIMICAPFLFVTSLNDGDEEVIFYNEQFDLNYKVWLKENDFYSNEYVGEDYNVVASSIDEIEIEFDYLLNFSNYVQGNSYYTINSYIIAYQESDFSKRKIWDYEKIIKDKVITLYDVDTTKVVSNDSFKINYQEYKELMNSYSKNYSVSLVGNLIIEIDIKSEFDYVKFSDKINLSDRLIRIQIPLTKQIVEITKEVPANSSQGLVEKTDAQINYLTLGLSVFCFLGCLILVVYLSRILIKIFGYDSKYVRSLSKILKSYNSIIVTVNKIEFTQDEKIMCVDEFDELLDAQSELRVPIFYCNIRANRECLFTLKYDKVTLVYRMKSDLYEKNKEKANFIEKDI